MTTSPVSLSGFAPAKVNLTLHVGPVKPNGRHNLDSLVVFSDASAADHLTAELAEDITLDVSGPTAPASGDPADNLVLRAALALKAASGTPKGTRLRLIKRLPVAAGIGGGSSDAAVALRLLTELWGVDPAHAIALAPSLGGDVPVALSGLPALMRGEGERVIPCVVPPVAALLVNPGVACPTGPIFRAYDAAGGGAGFAETDPPADLQDAKQLVAWLRHQRNDLEAPAIALVPEIAAVLETLAAQPGVLLARMSGSGATCFAIFEAIAFAERAGVVLKSQPATKTWWTAACRLGAAP
ncbi:4-(cytidine 5'-diphospho)-2-C-methyl-D-erythritol kinase [Hyphomonas sp. WL0036]|uniref:4-(cytidine 5'-diphospho)-2-C-methyl-D-erythritol kinase n=1 Tax=Hyphomonas sediminis TaxID=2866160 RepID=UPI001C813488|nr:4-(cytidine 5'-diphospho)-2-C-methyl-D-erythritol kinase [Hyphomonas sediminis]MBY9065362.1 4-(cytidine 5'-diphospho)-2-C-methyl-D-erythritol kinase [Hyphomonas sediminis]